MSTATLRRVWTVPSLKMVGFWVILTIAVMAGLSKLGWAGLG
jgi:hypothetical protein